MFNLGPMDIECEAPPYSVVKACQGLRFQSPLDVRWCRICSSMDSQPKDAFRRHPDIPSILD
jgi:hypothetical protein